MKIKISQTGTKVVSVNTQGTSEVVSVGIQGPAGPAGIENISDAVDVDTTDLRNGSVLVYSSTTNKWTSTITLDSQHVEAGEF